MSSESPDADPGDVRAAQVTNARIEDEMEQSYIDYAMSVIAGRALPDVRDGLKPVHRRILFAMNEAGVTSNSAHRKSSSVVGETMGDYHPHGDSAIYDTLARMAQDFSMRYPLVDGQGNFGSVDGDPPAAMRYTEARMAPIAEELMADIERDTVDFQANYDDRLEEPEVLPAAFPNLLVNGSSGIAVGMSTNIPPHNLGEVVDATVELIETPDASVEDLMEHVKGPDFPTGANIVGRNAVHKAYKTGRGRIRVRAEFEVDEEEGRIVISELPFQQNKSRLVERIAEDVNEGAIEGIRDLRDESDRDGIRIVVELKRDAMADVVKNQLLESHLERTFGVINLALVDGSPQVLDLKQTLEHYVDHRREVVRRRSEHELAEREDRAHILEGRLKALDNVDSVVETIQDSDDRDAAKTALESAFDFTEAQAAHIVRMQLGSLTSMETAEIEEEYEEVKARIERLETILSDPDELDQVIVDELQAIKAEYDDERRTSFIEDAGDVTHEDLIPEEEQVVVMSEDDYIKRMPLDEFRAQNRGGKGIIGTGLKEGDRVSSVFAANSHDYLLVFTNHGQIYELKTYEIPEMSRTARGKSAVNLLDLDDGEEIESVVNTEDLDDDEFLTMVTRDGYIKRTAVEEFGNIRSTGIRAIRLEDGDELVDVEVTDGERDIVIGSRDGMAIRFDESDARAMGRTARGVIAIDLREGDAVAGVAAIDDGYHNWVLTVTENGYGKRSDLDEYRPQSRNGKGLVDIKTGDRNGEVVAIEAVTHGDHLIAMSAAGQIMRTRVEEISTVSRNTKGVIVMNLDPDDEVASVDIVPESVHAAADDEGDDDAETDDE
ncbi:MULTISPECIES: DNA gyrase subunit A [Halorubrum]|jgi:DNA gyrase subunit A|uniref:DNA gyrase subunit A n=1 Tax=Halorubrum tropicale TaxID=1765655 RepID=A0A0M9ATG4_9EURY|nr:MULTISPECIES: DNA gyrase subunit A [Halorubrum]KOX97161.1 DNA gyrase subunit A [Halorubrum tropicale]RLM51703.1 DNA gyrase subunit A [Halorubrum sp. Atlit-28R]TKX41581.1 DNA gyrase subunit A [Halorubrum sp. ARQ200]TKX49188.1 DNA gyrase subunit A [Halorubrum sp. ASP121]TKX60868.1 DNA gyrase subunit A [Halorubrum sp. ASP1]